MGLQYAHMLIPERPDFVPEPDQVSNFFQKLVTMGSAPSDATIRFGKYSGRARHGANPLTGEKISIPVRDFVVLKDVSEIESAPDLNEYDLAMSGKGPAQLPPFALYAIEEGKEVEFGDAYAYEIRGRLRSQVVSTSGTPDFGQPCSRASRSGKFSHPRTGNSIEVPNSGCARFWVEFEFGKWLFSKIVDNFDVLEPTILKAATEAFDTSFAQGGIVR